MAQTTRPDYHFLYFAPTLGAEWFFVAARTYFERFIPTVLTDLRFLTLLPEGVTIVVTVIARRDSIAAIGVDLAQARPDVYMDPVVNDTLDETKAQLDARAASNGPFGVPGLAAGQQIAPTPGSLLAPTRGAAGFVTQTPTPTQVAPTLPEVTETREAIQPTPGPLIGG